jgi:hypothetical protein
MNKPKQSKNKGKRNTSGLKPCKPGETHNPFGRPKGVRNWKTIYKHLLEVELSGKEVGVKLPFINNQNARLTIQEMIALKHLKKALDKSRADDIKLIQDRTDGLLKQSIEVENIPVEISPDDKNLL